MTAHTQTPSMVLYVCAYVPFYIASVSTWTFVICFDPNVLGPLMQYMLKHAMGMGPVQWTVPCGAYLGDASLEPPWDRDKDSADRLCVAPFLNGGKPLCRVTSPLGGPTGDRSLLTRLRSCSRWCLPRRVLGEHRRSRPFANTGRGIG